MGDYPSAVKEYEAALEEPDYAAQYKALQGMAGALVEMGRYEDAALAYRQAALDGDNPDPGKALNNLGLCFMALDRPVDAIEAYKAALGFDSYSGAGKATANLGIAFAALGQNEEAIKAFEKATQFHGYSLSPQAVEAFNAAREAAEPQRETVEGWSTGEMPPVMPAESEEDGWSTGDLRTLNESTPEPESPILAPVVAEMPEEESDEHDESEFFTLTDSEMKERDKVARKEERSARRSEKNPWAIVAVIAAVVLLVIAAGATLYFLGFGYPTQSMTVSGMLDAHAQGQPAEDYWVAVPANDVGKEMAKLPPVKEYEISDVQRARTTSSVTVIVTPDNGAPLRYDVALTREGVGWKVTGIENDWRSTGGGS
jgi:tetratricopeptide (TPR) repeat protein